MSSWSGYANRTMLKGSLFALSGETQLSNATLIVYYDKERIATVKKKNTLLQSITERQI